MRARLARIIIIFFAVVVLLLAISAASNIFLPERSESVDKLSDAEKARIAEAIHLRETLGNAIWPGFGDEQIPIIVYNEQYAFLANFDGQPPVGWALPRSGAQQGTNWEPVPGDDFFGATYYRQQLVGSDTPQAFTVRLGDEWAASMTTYDWSRIKLVDMIRGEAPRWLRPFIPYRLVVGLFLGDSDRFIAALTHESFHAFIGLHAERHLVQAEEVARQQEPSYPWRDGAHVAAWQRELDILAAALRAEHREEAIASAQEFLSVREERRTSARLATRYIDYEQRREWLEGLAKYVELEAWRQGATAAGYTPHPATASLGDFNDYGGYERAWKREIDQIGRMAGDEGDGRFYYSGMAQAALLDRLLPDWKNGALTGGTTLEGLLDFAASAR
jgi:hypothetical protein